MLDNFDWFTRFFTYSSIQVKFIASFIAILSFIVVRKLFLKILFKNTSNALIRYRWQKISSYVINVLGIIIVGQIWFKGFESVATYLGLLSAGVAIALKDPLINLTGWAFILSRAPFVVGDRIQIGQHSGDVIDINFFKFTLMEVGHWGEGEQASGRIIHIPNGIDFPLKKDVKLVEYPKSWENKIPNNSNVLLFLGRFHKKKGINELIKAWEVVSQYSYSKNWWLCFVGSGNLKILKKFDSSLENKRILVSKPVFDLLHYGNVITTSTVRFSLNSLTKNHFQKQI